MKPVRQLAIQFINRGNYTKMPIGKFMASHRLRNLYNKCLEPKKITFFLIISVLVYAAPHSGITTKPSGTL